MSIVSMFHIQWQATSVGAVSENIVCVYKRRHINTPPRPPDGSLPPCASLTLKNGTPARSQMKQQIFTLCKCAIFVSYQDANIQSFSSSVFVYKEQSNNLKDSRGANIASIGGRGLVTWILPLSIEPEQSTKGHASNWTILVRRY